ncbi:glycosyltransferase [Cereibacter sphaeroides]|uniref:glycosyltransferase n=1 Tax=Cereibacter sphaeroides TaxID=1063 RepID=UPI003FCC5E76
MPRRYLLASARFIPKKNLPRLVAAYGKALRGRVEAPDLVILGDGPQRGDIETAIAVEGLVERIHLRGFRKYCELPAIYALSEGLVHVSTSEQWGLVINEAAAAGVPILASSACGATVPLVEDNVTGFVVDSESKDSIALGLTKLMDLDEARRHEMGRAAQIRVADWGLERFTNGLVAACRAAQACQSRGLMLWDSALLRVLARQPIGSVQ